MNPRGRVGPMRGRGGMMMGPRGGHGFHPYGGGPPRGAMRGQRGAFMSYPAMMPPANMAKHPVTILHEKLGVHPLAFSQGRLKIRRKRKGWLQWTLWPNCIRIP